MKSYCLAKPHLNSCGSVLQENDPSLAGYRISSQCILILSYLKYFFSGRRSKWDYFIRGSQCDSLINRWFQDSEDERRLHQLSSGIVEAARRHFLFARSGQELLQGQWPATLPTDLLWLLRQLAWLPECVPRGTVSPCHQGRDCIGEVFSPAV